MNGTLLDEIKKSGDTKKKEKLKFITSLIVSNIFVAIVAINMTISTNEVVPPKNFKQLHPGHKMIILPLKVLVDTPQNDQEIAVSLMNKSNKMVIEKAYLHNEIKDEGQLGGLPHFKIEIAETDLVKLSAHSELEMIALPAMKIKTQALRPYKRVSTYEINL